MTGVCQGLFRAPPEDPGAWTEGQGGQGCAFGAVLRGGFEGDHKVGRWRLEKRLGHKAWQLLSGWCAPDGALRAVAAQPSDRRWG